MSYIYYLIYYSNKIDDFLILDTYLHFSENCFNMLNNLFTIPYNNEIKLFAKYNTNNYFILVDKLIKDNIILNDFTMAKMLEIELSKKRRYTYQIIKKQDFSGKPFLISNIPMELINEILELIRNKQTDINIELKIDTIIEEYVKNDKYNTIHRSYCEVVLLCLLWELYFNYHNWVDNLDVSYSNLLYLDILLYSKSRINFTNNEINWICRIYTNIVINFTKINICKLLKKVLYEDMNENPTEPESNIFFIDVMVYENYAYNNQTIDRYYVDNSKKEGDIYYTDYHNKYKTHPIDKAEIIDKTLKNNSPIYIILSYILYYNFNINLVNIKKSNFMFDNDIININHFIINHLKIENGINIDLEQSFKLLKENNNVLMLFNNASYFNVPDIKAMLDYFIVFKIYSPFLNEKEKYEILKQIFINCKHIKKYKTIPVILLFIKKIILLLNLILPNIYFTNGVIDEMKYRFNEYDYNKQTNNIFSTCYSDSYSEDNELYLINDPEMIFWLYIYLLDLFEQDKPINKNKID